MRILTLAMFLGLAASATDAQVQIVRTLNAAGVTAVDSGGKRFTSAFAANHVFKFGNYYARKRLGASSPSFLLETEVDGPRWDEGETILHFLATGRAKNGTSIRSLHTSVDSKGTPGSQSYEVVFRVPAGRSFRVMTHNNGLPARATLNGNALPVGTHYIIKPGAYVLRVFLMANVRTSTATKGETVFGTYFSATFKLGGLYSEYGTRCGAATLSGGGALIYSRRYTLTLDKIPSNAPALLLVSSSRSSFGSFKLPLPLDSLGAKGCSLLVGSHGLIPVPLAVANGTATFGFRVPYERWTIYAQGLVFDKAANALGVTLTEAASLTPVR